MTHDTDKDQSLNEIDPTLRVIRIAASWEAKPYDGELLDVDFSGFLLDKNDKTREDEDFVFYNTPKSGDLSVRMASPDDLDAQDDAAIIMDGTSLSYEIYKIAFSLSLYLADERDQTMKRVSNITIRVINETTGQELARYPISGIDDNATGAEIAVLERVGTDWFVKTEPVSATKGLKEIAEKYGCIIASIG